MKNKKKRDEIRWGFGFIGMQGRMIKKKQAWF